MIRTYSELRRIDNFKERFKYLSLRGTVAEVTFGYDRWINQEFYTSHAWRRLRHHIIVRDNGCDLGLDGWEIQDRIYIHHMNPMSAKQIQEGDPEILNPEYLISTSHNTHNAIHYGDERLLPKPYAPRRPGDTKLW